MSLTQEVAHGEQFLYSEQSHLLNQNYSLILLSVDVLTHYSIDTRFNTAIAEGLRNHCDKRRNCS